MFADAAWGLLVAAVDERGSDLANMLFALVATLLRLFAAIGGSGSLRRWYDKASCSDGDYL
jgi:hypothetical protein